MVPQKITNVRFVGKQKTRDITVDSEEHRFYANGVVVSNSHAYAYAMFSAWQLYLKVHYPMEFLCSCMNAVDRTKEKKGVSLLEARVKYAESHGVRVLLPDVNASEEIWTITPEGLRAGLSGINGIGSDASKIVAKRPYEDVKDFIEKTGMSKTKFESLLFAGAFDSLANGDSFITKRPELYNWYYNFYERDEDEDQPSLSGEIEIKKLKSFSIKGLLDRELEMNGFLIPESVKKKYAKTFNGDKELLTVTEAVEKGNKYALLLANIVSAKASVSKKSGKECVLVELSDGFDNITLYMGKVEYESHKSVLVAGTAVILGVSFSDDRGMCFLNSKVEIKKVKPEAV